MKNKKKLPTQPLTVGAAKVPVVIQLEALECGAACLTMILAYYVRCLCRICYQFYFGVVHYCHIPIFISDGRTQKRYLKIIFSNYFNKKITYKRRKKV